MSFSLATKQTAMFCILFFVFLTLAAEGNMLVRACPQQGGACDCNSVTRSVTCTRLGSLTRRLPLGIPANTKVLTVNHSTLSRLGPTAFRNCYQLEVVDLSDNRLEDISQLAFQSLARLRSLNLSDNRLRVVTEDTFLHLKRLEFLDLSRNRLIVLTPDNFKNLHNLRELKLSSNPTMCIAPSAFWGMKKLQVLEMSDMIATLDEGLFRDLERLQRLVLRSFSQVTEIPANLLQNNRMLCELRIENLSKLGSHGIPKTLLTGLSRLHTLSLKACNLDNIPKQLLDRVQRSIVELDLSHNLIKKVKELDFKNLYYLKTLNLRRTGLTLIESGALNLSNLVNIDLYGNNLSVMTESVFGDSMKTLRNVSLANNPWVCDCRLRWIIRSSFVTTTDRPVVCVQPPWMQGYNIRSPVDHSTLRVDSFSCKGANITDFGFGKSRETSLSLGSSMAPVTIKVVCKSDGFPKPKVRWVLPYVTALNDGAITQRNSVNLEKSKRDRLNYRISCFLCDVSAKHPTVDIKVSKDGSLHLHMVAPQQATGVYTCRSSNQFGGSEMSFVITRQKDGTTAMKRMQTNRSGEGPGMWGSRGRLLGSKSMSSTGNSYSDNRISSNKEFPTIPLLSQVKESEKDDSPRCRSLLGSHQCETLSGKELRNYDYTEFFADTEMNDSGNGNSMQPSSSKAENVPSVLSVKNGERNGCAFHRVGILTFTKLLFCLLVATVAVV
ncbi:uncharacterized protein LOC100175382 [Ciona intestinalis]